MSAHAITKVLDRHLVRYVFLGDPDPTADEQLRAFGRQVDVLVAAEEGNLARLARAFDELVTMEGPRGAEIGAALAGLQQPRQLATRLGLIIVYGDSTSIADHPRPAQLGCVTVMFADGLRVAVGGTSARVSFDDVVESNGEMDAHSSRG